MVHRLVLILFFLLPTYAFAGSSVDFSSTDWFGDFSSTDYKFQVVSTAITFADLNQTLQFAEKGHSEQNTFLGDHPSDSKINTLVGLAIVGQWVVAWALPSEAELFGFKYNPRRTFQVGVIVGEGWAVHHNYKAGINIEF